MSEITTPSTTKSAIQLGTLFGLLMILEFVIAYVMDIDPISNPTAGIVMNLLNYLIFPVLFITMACNAYKTSNGGFISFGKCLKIGVTLCVIAGLVYAIFSSVFMMIFPEFVDELLRKTNDVMSQQPGMTPEALEMTMSWTKKMLNPTIAIPTTIAMFAFFGLIFSLIIGAIVKKDNPHSF